MLRKWPSKKTLRQAKTVIMNERRKGDDDSSCSKRARCGEDGSTDHYQTTKHKTRQISHPLECHRSFFLKKKRLIVHAPKTIQTSCSRVLLFPVNENKKRRNFPNTQQKTWGRSRYGQKKFRQAQSLEHYREEGRNKGSVPSVVRPRQTKLQTRMFRVTKTSDCTHPHIVNLKPLPHLAKSQIAAIKIVAQLEMQ